MKAGTIVWDYNGTILDDIGICLEIENEMLRRRGLPNEISVEWYREHFGFPVIDYYYRIGYTFATETYEEVSEEFNQLYEEAFPRAGLRPDFLPFIEDACSKGWQNVIISASRQDKLISQCKQLGIADYFSAMVGIDDHMAGSKIDKAMAWQKRTGTRPEEMISIGDTLHDLETAKALGIKKCWLVAGGHQSRKVLETSGAEVVDTLSQIIL
ncbi:MAG: HAD family hydrolase [Solobacterium sp.]|nr:HAD family hydrolase [Solobacterium sp.]